MQSSLILLLKYKYWILFPLAAIEGPVVALIVGFLVYSGTFNFLLAYIILLFGDIIPDTIYFYIGYFGGDREFIKRLIGKSKIFTEHFDIIKKLWRDHPFKTMFFGKLAYGMATPFLVSSGMVKISYKKFLTLTVPITLFQYGLIMSIGYYMGNSYNLVLKYIDLGYIFLAIVVVLFIIIYVLVAKYAQREIILMEEREEKIN